jgi:hypothetical protein
MYNRYIASTLFQEDDDTPDTEKKENLTSPPKVLGVYPGTEEKVKINCCIFLFCIFMYATSKECGISFLQELLQDHISGYQFKGLLIVCSKSMVF